MKFWLKYLLKNARMASGREDPIQIISTFIKWWRTLKNRMGIPIIYFWISRTLIKEQIKKKTVEGSKIP